MRNDKGTGLRSAGRSVHTAPRPFPAPLRPIEAPQQEPFSQPRDGELTERLAVDDSSALEELIRDYWDRLITYAARILGERLGAEDVVQEAFVRLWSRRHSLESVRPAPFLFRVVRNLALDEVRSRDARRRREIVMARDEPRPPSTPADVLRREGVAAAVDAAIRSLPDRRREAFTLAYLGGLSYRELSEVMEISEKTVSHHISAALAELRTKLAPLLDELP